MHAIHNRRLWWHRILDVGPQCLVTIWHGGTESRGQLQGGGVRPHRKNAGSDQDVQVSGTTPAAKTRVLREDLDGSLAAKISVTARARKHKYA